MKIGFTGTQQGMTDIQKDKLKEYLMSLSNMFTSDIFEACEFHHGDCIGADDQAGCIAYDIGYIVVTHPPINESKRAFSAYDIQLPAKPYLDRNHDIVDECEVLIATPKEQGEVLRSGTWATIRYARSKGKRVIKITPDGEIWN